MVVWQCVSVVVVVAAVCCWLPDSERKAVPLPLRPPLHRHANQSECPPPCCLPIGAEPRHTQPIRYFHLLVVLVCCFLCSSSPLPPPPLVSFDPYFESTPTSTSSTQLLRLLWNLIKCRIEKRSSAIALPTGMRPQWPQLATACKFGRHGKKTLSFVSSFWAG